METEEMDADEEATEGDDGTDESDTPAPVVHGVERSTHGCPEGSFRNHGAYISSTQERPRNEAAKSNCGMPACRVLHEWCSLM